MKPVPCCTPHVLLVDDNSDGLLVRRALLQEAGCVVHTARNGEEALQLFDRSKFDLVVTDFRMPLMDGIELIQHIRERDPHARVILLSGFVDPLGLNEATTGADVVLAKSSTEATLLGRAVKRLLNRTVKKPPASVKKQQAGAKASGL